MGLPERKRNHLKGYDYSSTGAYFVTICTQGKRCILSDIVGEGLAPPVVRLTQYGKAADEQVRQIEVRYPTVQVDRYVIMPNHIHMLLSIRQDAGGASPSPTLMDIVRVFKSQTTRQCGRGANLFQRSFYDHVVRNEHDFREIWNYIKANPVKWKDDRFYMKGKTAHDFPEGRYRT